MKGPTFKASNAAMTLVELLLVIAVIGVLAGLLMPARTGRGRIPMLSCNVRLRTVGVTFQMWAADHEGMFPMQLSTNKGGTLEFATTGSAAAHFNVLAPYFGIKTPGLVCPADDIRRQAAQKNPGVISDQTVSYFVGLDVIPFATNSFLSGDRHLSVNGVPVRSGLLSLTTDLVLS